jgi:polyphosphate kinase
VTDPVQRQRLVDECLTAYLQDQVDAWELGADGNYVRVKALPRKKAKSAQATLMARYGRNIQGK